MKLLMVEKSNKTHTQNIGKMWLIGSVGDISIAGISARVKGCVAVLYTLDPAVNIS